MKQHTLSLKQYIRTNDDGEKVLDYYDLLDESDQMGFIEVVKNIAASTELEFDVNDPAFSEAENIDGIDMAAHFAVLDNLPSFTDDGEDVITEWETEKLMVEIIAQELRDRYLS